MAGWFNRYHPFSPISLLEKPSAWTRCSSGKSSQPWDRAGKEQVLMVTLDCRIKCLLSERTRWLTFPLGAICVQNTEVGSWYCVKNLFLLHGLKAEVRGRDFLGGGGGGTEPNLLLHDFMWEKCLIPWQRGLFCSTSLVHEIELLRRSWCTEPDMGEPRSHKDMGNHLCLLKSSFLW